MIEAQTLFDKLEKLSLRDTLNLCALAIDEKMEQKRLDMILLLAETKLNKYRTMVSLGMKPE